MKNDNDDVNRDDEEKFGDLSRPLADQFTHPPRGHNQSFTLQLGIGWSTAE